jgi:hypothetical protein
MKRTDFRLVRHAIPLLAGLTAMEGVGRPARPFSLAIGLAC